MVLSQLNMVVQENEVILKNASETKSFVIGTYLLRNSLAYIVSMSTQDNHIAVTILDSDFDSLQNYFKIQC